MLFAVNERSSNRTWSKTIFADNWKEAELFLKRIESPFEVELLGPIYLIGYPGSNPENREKVDG